jgi:hypothetical protein
MLGLGIEPIFTQLRLPVILGARKDGGFGFEYRHKESEKV